MNEKEAESVDVRQELDLKIGCAFTRLITREVLELARARFEEELGPLQVVSYGPCQTPTLLFCVKRAKEIINFVEQDYWTVEANGVFLPKKRTSESGGIGGRSGGESPSVPLQWCPDKTFDKRQAVRACEQVKF
jgi:DNA topoisomerase IA